LGDSLGFPGFSFFHLRAGPGPPGVAKVPGGRNLEWRYGRSANCHRPSPSVRERVMGRQPELSAQDLRDQLLTSFEELCEDVARAVNQAEPGQVINQSEEKVRDLLADFRLAAYQAAVQLRLDAAEAAFSPSAEPTQRQAPAEQGA
jgi:NTP pyrophosphatase (non-canonical NTP hydrolase)